MRCCLLALAVLAVLMLALAACSGNDDDQDDGVQLQMPPTNTPVTPSVVSSVTPIPQLQAWPQSAALLIVRGNALYMYSFPAVLATPHICSKSGEETLAI